MSREQELRSQLAKLYEAHKRRWNDDTRDIYKELTEIESRKPPAPVTLPDGRIMHYTGPWPL